MLGVQRAPAGSLGRGAKTAQRRRSGAQRRVVVFHLRHATKPPHAMRQLQAVQILLQGSF